MKTYHLFAGYPFEGQDYIGTFESIDEAKDARGSFGDAEIYETKSDGSLKHIASYGTWGTGTGWRDVNANP